MALQSIVIYVIPLFFAYVGYTLQNPGPSFDFSWLDGKNKFKAGDNATIKIKVNGSFDPNVKHTFVPSISVHGKSGNSSYISSLSFNLVGDPGFWSLSFVPIKVGNFKVLITEDRFGILNSSLHFVVDPGPVNPSMSVASWAGPDTIYECEAGAKAIALVLPKDAFGNSILKTDGEVGSYAFSVHASYDNGSNASILDVSSLGWNRNGYLRIEFIAVAAGQLFLHITEGTDQYFEGSPLPFKVRPGTVDTSKCVANWKYGSNFLQLNSALEIFIQQLDTYGNLAPGLYPFDAEVVEADTRLTIPVTNLRFVELSYGVQLLTFSATEPGNFLLLIYDAKTNKNISNVPYSYTVFVGYCDQSNSFINGSEKNTSIAGQEERLSITLIDKYQYPSPVEIGILQVQINQENSLDLITADISASSNGISIYHEELAPSPFFGNINVSAENSSVFAYNALYTPQKAGIYDIRFLCGNIMLNGGNLLKKNVTAGEVNISMSAVVRYEPKVRKEVKSEIVISLVDSFWNPVLSQESRLKVDVNSTNQSTWNFIDNKDGSYTGSYCLNEVGTYELRASFDGNLILPSPFLVNAYIGEYFPQAHDDVVNVLEDESVVFNVLGNDEGDNVKVINFSHPRHGSVLRYGQNFRYTPRRDYFGNDSFTYSISDVNENVAAASVKISIFSIPPQFESYPTQLEAIEDYISPKFCGFHGFEIKYGDPLENMTVTVSAKVGAISLYPKLMTFWMPSWNDFVVRDEAGNLIFIGRLQVLNSVLNSIQYLGMAGFYGEDVITIIIRTENETNDASIAVSVDPVNDPPFIRAPEYIVLENNTEGEGSSLYNKEKNETKFAIGDPDSYYFRGEKSQFLVMLSMEVDSGLLEAILPSNVINTAELKLKRNSHWQPLQTYVSISEHCRVKTMGLRIHATIDDSNNLLQQLKFHGEEDDGALLTLSVNDLGNYGCNSPDCSDNTSRPLFVEANIKLLNRKPINSIFSYALGTAIILELVMVLSLGVVVLYFTSKCIMSLADRQTCSEQKFGLKMDKHKSEAGCCQMTSLFGDGPSSSHQRPKRQPGGRRR